jgi:hypothetical protein
VDLTIQRRDAEVPESEAMMAPPPPHHRDHHRHRPHAHERMVEFEGELTHSEIDQVLRRMGEQLAQAGCLELGEHKIVVPDPVQTLVLQERGPKGDLIVKLEFKWMDGASNGGSLPIADLLA